MKISSYRKPPNLKNGFALRLKSNQEFKQVFGVESFEKFIEIIENHDLEFSIFVDNFKKITKD